MSSSVRIARPERGTSIRRNRASSLIARSPPRPRKGLSKVHETSSAARVAEVPDGEEEQAFLELDVEDHVRVRRRIPGHAATLAPPRSREQESPPGRAPLDAVDEQLEAFAGAGLDERARVDLAELLVSSRDLGRERFEKRPDDASGPKVGNPGIGCEARLDQGGRSPRRGIPALGEFPQRHVHARILARRPP